MAKTKLTIEDVHRELQELRADLIGKKLTKRGGKAFTRAAEAVHPQNVAVRVKHVLSQLTNVPVTNERTMKALGLGAEEVQLAMNTEFFTGTNVRLSEGECGSTVTVQELIITINAK